MRTNRISLHHLTILDASPTRLVEIAAMLGCPLVTLFTQVPAQARGFYPLVSPDGAAILARLLADHDVRCGNIEVFALDSDRLDPGFAVGLESGAILGAPSATAHMHDVATIDQAIARFAAFCELAAGYNISPRLEFNGFSAIKTLDDAAKVVRGAGQGLTSGKGQGNPQGGVILDCLHLIRNTACLSDIAHTVAAQADLIDTVQICDGPLLLSCDDPKARFREAVKQRALPGAGQFPLDDILRQLPDGIMVEAEIPQSDAHQKGVDCLERARRALNATGRLLTA